MFICNNQLLSVFFLSCLLPILISDVFPLPLSWQVEEYSDCSINFAFDIIWDNMPAEMLWLPQTVCIWTFN